MLKAKITIFDDETERRYLEDYVVEPYKKETYVKVDGLYNTTTYEFRLNYMVMN